MNHSKEYLKKARVDSGVHDPVDQNPFTATSVYDRLNQIKFDSDDSNNSGVWSGINQINSYINRAIKTSTNDDQLAYYIGPTNFGFDSIEGVQDIAKHICRRGGVPNSFYGSKESLDKPFIVISNTATVLAKSSTDVNQQGGIHWISWVLLPKSYASLSGKQIDNDKHQVLFFDSLGQRSFPEELKKFLTEGGEITEKTNTGEVKVRLMPFCRKEEIDFQDLRRLTGQQMNGSDCGWWATYYALMSVYTGGVEFLQKLKGKKLSAKPLRREMNLQEVDHPLYREQKTCKREPISIFQRISWEKDQQKKQLLKGLLNRLRGYYSDELKMGAAVASGDCFFDSLAQGLNELSNEGLIRSDDGIRFSVKSLRQDCASYAGRNNDRNSWIYKQVVRDASFGGYFIAKQGPSGPIQDPITKNILIDEDETFREYVNKIGKVVGNTIWGRPNIEGRMISDRYDVVLYYYSINEEYGQKITVTKVTPLNDDPEVFIEGEFYDQLQFNANEKAVRVVGYRNHFVPLLSKLEREIQEVIEVSEQEVYGIAEHKQSSPDTFVGRKEEFDTLCDAVQFRGGKVVTSQVEAFNRFGLGKPSDLFVGRVEELKNLHNALYNNSSFITALTGSSGIGKSELARQYIQKYSESHYNGNTIWIDAQDDDNLFSSLKKLARDRLLTLVERTHESMGSILEGIYKYFVSKNKKTLFVFDCDGASKSLFQVLKIFRERAREIPCFDFSVLVTSCNGCEELVDNSINLGPLELEEAVELVKKGLQLEDGKARTLARELWCFPFSIIQAMALILAETNRINKSLSTTYLLRSLASADALNCSAISVDDNIKIFFKVASVAYQKIIAYYRSYPTISVMLPFMCYIVSDKMEVEMLLNFLSYYNRISIESLQFELAIDFLARLGIVEYKGCGAFSMDRVLQKMIRLYLECRDKSLGMACCRYIIEGTFRFFTKELDKDGNKLVDDTRRKCLLPHCEAFLSNIGFPDIRPEWSKEFSGLLSSMSKEYDYIRDPFKREILLRKALDFYVKNFSPTGLEVFTSQVELSITYLYLRNHELKIHYLEAAISNLRYRVYSNSTELRYQLLIIDYVAGSLDSHKQRKFYLEKILSAKKSLYSHLNFSSDIAVTALYLAASYGYLGRKDKKASLLKFASKKIHPCEKDCDMLVEISHAYCSLNDFSSQVKFLYSAYKQSPDRYAVIPVICVNLGVALLYLGDYQSGISWIYEVLPSLEKHYNHDHCELAHTKLLLASAYQNFGVSLNIETSLLADARDTLFSGSMGQVACIDISIHAHLGMHKESPYDKKERALKTALKILKKHDNSHDMWAVCLLLMLFFLYFRENPTQGHSCLRCALDIVESYHADKNIGASYLLLTLASGYGVLGNFSAQEKLLKKARDAFSTHESGSCFACLSNADVASDVASLYGFLGEHKQKLKLLKQAVDIQEGVYPRGHFQLARTQTYLAQYCSSLGTHSETQNLLKKSIPVLEKKCKDNNRQSIFILLDLADAYLSLGFLSLSIRSLSSALNIQNKYSVESIFADTFLRISALYGYVGQFDKQNSSLNLALEIQMRYYPPGHPMIISTLKKLSCCLGRLGLSDQQVARLNEILKTKYDYSSRLCYEDFLTHAELNCANSSVSQSNKEKSLEFVTTVISSLDCSDIRKPFLLFKLGSLYMSLSNFKRSAQLLKGASELYSKLPVDNNPVNKLHHIDTLVALSWAYGYSGNYQDQKKSLKIALGLQESYYNTSHFVVLVTLVNLAIAAQIRFDDKKSLSYLNDVMVRLLASQSYCASLSTWVRDDKSSIPEEFVVLPVGCSCLRLCQRADNLGRIHFDDLLNELGLLINAVEAHFASLRSIKEQTKSAGSEVLRIHTLQKIIEYHDQYCAESLGDGTKREGSLCEEHSFYGQFLEKVRTLYSSVSRIANEVRGIGDASMKGTQPTSSFALVPASDLVDVSIKDVFFKRPSVG